MPGSIAEAYFDYVLQLVRAAEVPDRVLALDVVKGLAKAATGTRFIPGPFNLQRTLRQHPRSPRHVGSPLELVEPAIPHVTWAGWTEPLDRLNCRVPREAKRRPAVGPVAVKSYTGAKAADRTTVHRDAERHEVSLRMSVYGGVEVRGDRVWFASTGKNRLAVEDEHGNAFNPVLEGDALFLLHLALPASL